MITGDTQTTLWLTFGPQMNHYDVCRSCVNRNERMADERPGGGAAGLAPR